MATAPRFRSQDDCRVFSCFRKRIMAYIYIYIFHFSCVQVYDTTARVLREWLRSRWLLHVDPWQYDMPRPHRGVLKGTSSTTMMVRWKPTRLSLMSCLQGWSISRMKRCKRDSVPARQRKSPTRALWAIRIHHRLRCEMDNMAVRSRLCVEEEL